MVVDSSVWLEIFRSGPLQPECERLLQKGTVKVPSIVLFEVYRKIKKKLSEDLALEAVATLSRYEVLDLNREITLLAGDLAIEHTIGMVDSMVLAHAFFLKVPLITLDNDLAEIAGVTVVWSTR
jgi:predicted nucleic acid-binding protein